VKYQPAFCGNFGESVAYCTVVCFVCSASCLRTLWLIRHPSEELMYVVVCCYTLQRSAFNKRKWWWWWCI